MKYIYLILLLFTSLNAKELIGYENADAQTVSNILCMAETPEKISMIRKFLLTCKDSTIVTLGDKDKLQHSCRSHRELWINYIAGYVKFNNPQFIAGTTHACPLNEFKPSVQVHEYSLLHSLYGACLFPSGDVIAGLANEVKISQSVTYKYYFWPIYESHKKTQTYLKLIHLPTKKILLKKRIYEPFTSRVIIPHGMSEEMEIVNHHSYSCEKVNIASYYEALNNYQNVPLEDYIFYSQYDAAY